MSGIVALVNVEGGPIDRRLLETMTRALSFRGPDAQRVWSDGCVGLGHTLLATTDEAAGEQQPASIDGRVWIAADARIDARDELRAQLAAAGEAPPAGATDVDLILHAYRAWDRACVDHLLGDFAFAIWDGPRRRLFCARDHFGIRPCFYAFGGGALVVSNTLDCVRLHPSVSDELNEHAIADFLLFKRIQTPEHTAFRDIVRLPAAHTLAWTPGSGPQVRRYWDLQVPPLRRGTQADYIEGLHAILRAAVRDRMRTRRIALSMSGGLDSPAVAATAKAVAAADGTPAECRAFTISYAPLTPDEEAKYAQLVADTLKIPVSFLRADRYLALDGIDRGDLPTPEPADQSAASLWGDHFAAMAAYSRVALTGHEADAVLREMIVPHLSGLVKARKAGQLTGAVARYIRWFHRLPPVGLRAAMRRAAGRGVDRKRPELPIWLDDNFVERLDLAGRWHEVASRDAFRTHRPKALWVFSSPQWSTLMEEHDAASTQAALELRHPFADRRVVEFLLSLPAVPWCIDKTLLRLAFRGILPDAIVERKKTFLIPDPLMARLRRPEAERFARLIPTPALARYVKVDRVPAVTGPAARDHSVYEHLRPVYLSYWLKRHQAGMTTLTRGEMAI